MSTVAATFPVDQSVMQQFADRMVSPFNCFAEVDTTETTVLCMAIWNVWVSGDDVRARLLLKSAKENVKKLTLKRGLHFIARLADPTCRSENYTSFITACRELGLDLK